MGNATQRYFVIAIGNIFLAEISRFRLFAFQQTAGEHFQWPAPTAGMLFPMMLPQRRRSRYTVNVSKLTFFGLHMEL